MVALEHADDLSANVMPHRLEQFEEQRKRLFVQSAAERMTFHKFAQETKATNALVVVGRRRRRQDLLVLEELLRLR